MTNQIVINTDPKTLLEKSEVASKVAISKEGVDALVQILEWQKQIEETLDTLKLLIPLYADEFMPGFLGVIDKSKRLSVIYRAYGSKYMIEDQQLAQGFLQEKVTWEVNTDKVEEYKFNHGGELPDGIKERERSKKLSIELKKEKNEK